MIKFKLDENGEIEYAVQGNRVVLTVLFDLNGSDKSLQVKPLAKNLHGMTVDQVKDYIVPKVEAKRAELLSTGIKALLDPLTDVDLEAV